MGSIDVNPYRSKKLSDSFKRTSIEDGPEESALLQLRKENSRLQREIERQKREHEEALTNLRESLSRQLS